MVVPLPSQAKDLTVHRRSAFTLIEMLLSLGLLALVSVVLISGVSGFFQLKEARPDDNFWSAVTSARQAALDHEQVVTLQFDQEKKLLIWSWDDASDSLALPVGEVRFLPVDKTSTQLLGGVLMETDPMSRVRFYPDGTCDAFRAELVTADQRRRVLQIDPWTCAPVLTTASR